MIAGSLGEAIHLSHTERVELIKVGRQALDNAGFKNFPVVVGIGAGSTRETIELGKEAASAGADYALVIASGYFAGALTRVAIKTFFVEVSRECPIPIIIYNCRLFVLPSLLIIQISLDPGASGGIDLDSDLIIELATECPNIVGVKLTYVIDSLS